ncbi:conserved hypothetical protein [Uncinocarpus reesii 1704]|uniref:RNA binding protein Nrd1 n=1 Tax=Uncinocarpus reesii (strain UAMH 1704) TaxID=336963 RepID=C4JMN3_UNCRE|nr:uncharacterized protein UREG_04091 [Uncinocarpus reesii 1704]EEP79245.1 conserved hypothetical protein [Uncinocarpus reesii 1704]
MSSAVAELDGYLQSMLALKPPGVSRSKIDGITSLCTANVQWVDSARKAGQPTDSNALDGTFAAGVKRVTDLLPVLMTDIINNAPEDQKDKIRKLVDIWERGATFPAAMLSSFKQKLNAPVSQNVQSTTPEGSPAPGFNPLLGLTQQPQQGVPAVSSTPTQAVPDTSSILKALADMAKQNTAAAPTIPTPAQTSSNNVLNAQSTAPAPISSSVEQTAPQPNGQAVNPYAGNLAAQFAGLSNLAPNMFPNQAQTQPLAPHNPLAALLQPQQLPSLPPQQQQPQSAPSNITPEALQQQLGLIQLLAAQGIPQDQWATALQILSLSSTANAGMGALNPAAMLSAFGQPAAQNAWGAPAHDTSSRDRDRERERDHDYMRSPPNQFRRRSRSPGWERRREASPPRRRDSPVYGEYHGESPGRNRADGRDGRGGRRGNDYRQRSPPGRRRRSPSPPRKDSSLPPPGPKHVEWDYSIGQGNIKVLSRTLFVGGVTASESHLRSLFSRYGAVQTCIVNIDKRHAFVKMVTRRDAVTARDGMEQYKSGDMQLRTRWGVGFGPRDCSDYQTGISVIPIERLTEADRKWMLTAEYGGTGGKPIESGMVVEEPDIEIGAGVSSKAISRRMATDQGGKRGPQSSRPPFEQPRFRRQERGSDDGPGSDRDHDNSSANNVAVPPAVPGFGFQLPGMPMFPPGFMMGGAQPASSTTTPQPPAPGSGS